MESQIVFVGLGGNLGDVPRTMQLALQEIESLPGVSHLEVSQFYSSSPVSDLPQPRYLNAVCRFRAIQTAPTLLRQLQEIQCRLGQAPKPKNAPRLIDLDILFFGAEVWQTAELEIPHPRWSQRLFVMKPLLELIRDFDIPGVGAGPANLIELINNISCCTEQTAYLWNPGETYETCAS